jgi:hypothetical protein
MLARCLAAIGTGNWDGSLCDWFAMPEKPGTQAAASHTARFKACPTCTRPTR